MAIDSRIGTKINKSLRTDLAPATNISPFPYIGIVKNNLDPTRCGRVQVFIPELGGNPDDPSNWRTISYASPFMGYTSTEINQTDVQNNKESFTNVSHTYGMWMVPPDIGVEVICMFIAGDPMRGYWVACVNSNLSRYMLPGLAGSTNVNSTFATANAKASYTPGDQPPVVEFNENIPANETNSNFYNAPKPIHETQYAVLKQQGLNRDTVRGTISSSSQRETPSQVFGISTPGRPLNDPADDPNYVRKLNAGTLTEDYYRVKSRKGGHTFVMDDGSVLGVDQLVRLRTAGGHQILMHDTEQTIYIGQSQGNSWIELSKDGSINVFSHGGLNLRSEGDINFHSDGNINLNADKHLNLHANKISNVAATYSLPDTSFNSNTGTWNSTDNQLNSIATVAPTHEPFDRLSVASTSEIELSSSTFVDMNQLIEANLGMQGYVDSVASQSTYGDSNVNAYLTQFDGNIVPSANLIYSLGNITHQWKDLFVGNSTIYVGGVPVSVDSTGNLTVNSTVIPTIGYVDARVSDIGGSSYGNANVGAYLITNNYLTSSSANLSLYVWNANVTAANLGLKGYVDLGNTIQTNEIIQANLGLKGYVDNIILGASNYSNVNVAAYLTTFGYATNSVVTLANTIQSNQIAQANAGIKGYIDNQITNLVGGAPSILDTLGELANALGADANLSVTITSQIANVNANITTANIGMKGYVDNAVSTANIGIIGYINQANTIQSAQITAANIGIIGYIDQGNSIQATAITTANIGMKGYVDSQIFYSNARVATYLQSGNPSNISVAGNVTATYFIGNGALLTGIAASSSYGNTQVEVFTNLSNYAYNANVTSANLGMKGYVDNSVSTANIGMKGYVDSVASQSLYGNVNVKAYTESMGFQNYGNANVASYLITNNYLTTNNAYSNVNVAAYLTTNGYALNSGLSIYAWNANVTNYSNVNTAAYTQTMGFTNYSNVNVAAFVTTNGLTNYSNVNVAAYVTTNGLTNYSNVNVAAYLTTNSYLTTTTANLSTYAYNANVTAANVGMKGYVDSLVGSGATVGQQLITTRQANTATQGQTIFTLVSGVTYTPGTGQLRVYINGVRQFPSEYTETSSTVYTLTSGVSAGDIVFAEIDNFSTFNNYANLTYASNVGNISASGLTVQAAIESLENNKAPLTSPVFTGNITAPNLIGTANNANFLGGTPAASYAQLSGATFTGNVTATNITINGLTTLTETTETLDTRSGLTGTIVHDFSTTAIWYYSNIAGNVTANLTNVPTTDNRITSVSIIVNQGATGFIINGLQINGAAQTIRWQGNTVPTASTNRLDVFTFSLLRAANAWTVLGSATTHG